MRISILSSSVLLATFASSAQAQSVLHYWNFESASDVVGGVPTSVVGTTDLSVHATYGEAYAGAGQSLNTVLGGTGAGGGFLEADVHDGASATALDFGTSDHAISYWSYNADDGDVRGPRVFDHLEATTTGVQLGTNATNAWNLRMDDDAGNSLITPPPILMQGTGAWMHVVINVDRTNDQVEVFFDGTSQAVISAAGLTGSLFPTMDMQIGAINGGTNVGQAQQAGLDDLAFYDGLLDAQAVAGLADGSLNPADFNELGTSVCSPAVANSTGGPASIRAFGVLNADVTLRASGMPLNENGYFLASDGFLATPFTPPGSTGNFCLATGVNLGRYSGDVLSSGASGEFSLAIDPTMVPWAGGGGMGNPTTTDVTGQTWYFSCWYRDGATSNFTDVVCIQFL